jgi:dTDP-4-dehydrorhamnose reductase
MLSKKKILVVGSEGMLGSALVARLKEERLKDKTFELFAADELDCDITDHEEMLLYVMSIAPNLIINCAAYTDVDGAESHAPEAYLVNGDGPKNLAEACYNCGTRLIHMSTEYVFDGTKGTPYVETDEPRPLSEYGKSKLRGEKNIGIFLQNYLILRTSWLFGPRGKNFIDTVLRLANEREEIKMVADQSGAPTYTVDLADGICRLIHSEITGIYNLAGADYCTWYELAQYVLDVAGRKARMTPIDTAHLDRPAKRPLNCRLDCSKIEREAEIRLRPWRETVAEYIKKYTMKSSSSGNLP